MTRIKMKHTRYWITPILCVIAFLAGCLLTYKMQKRRESKPMVVDFTPKPGTIIDYNPDFIGAAGLFYLYQKESKGIKKPVNYLDTLTYFKRSILYYNIEDTDYLVIFKPRAIYDINDPIYGFTRSKFLTYYPKEVLLKNFGGTNAHRSTDARDYQK